MGERRFAGAAGIVLAASALLAGAQAGAEPVELPPGIDLRQFYPAQEDLAEGWTLGGASLRLSVSAELTTPPGCSFAALFPAADNVRADGPDNAILLVRVLREPSGLQTIRSWAGKCASFTMLGGGGTTGRNWMSAQSVEAPVPGALAYRITGQGPFAKEELEFAGQVRGALLLVSQIGPADDGPAGDTAAAQMFRRTAAKISAWQG